MYNLQKGYTKEFAADYSNVQKREILKANLERLVYLR